MADRYKCFAELTANERLGIDYRICVEDRGAQLVVFAPHGGWIEPNTSEIAEAVAGLDFSFYAFEGLENRPHTDLHITSHPFDEPTAIDIVGRCHYAVAIHGRKDNGDESVWLGGRDAELRDAIGSSLRKAGFDADFNQMLPGTELTNICNRTLSRKGVQLELPRSLRRKLARDTSLRETFCEAVRCGLPST